MDVIPGGGWASPFYPPLPPKGIPLIAIARAIARAIVRAVTRAIVRWPRPRGFEPRGLEPRPGPSRRNARR